MKIGVIAGLTAFALTGCVAVPAPYYSDGPYYYPAPAVGVGIYAAPWYHGHHHHHRGDRHYRQHH